MTDRNRHSLMMQMHRCGAMRTNAVLT